MKKKLPALLLIAILSASPVIADDGVDECATDTIKASPNPLISIISFPFKVVVALSYPFVALLTASPKTNNNPPLRSG